MARPITVEEHLTINEAAARTRFHRNEISQELKRGLATEGREGIYPWLKRGRAVRIPASSLARFLERLQVKLPKESKV
jgi:hypothetical protein